MKLKTFLYFLLFGAVLSLLTLQFWLWTSNKDTRSDLAPKTTINEDKKKIAIVGDLSCPSGSLQNSTNCQAAEVAKAIVAKNVDAVLLPGDLQYYYGDEANFNSSFAKDWAPILSKAYAVPGNHEYGTPNAMGYFNFWASQTDGLARGGDVGKGYYSFNLGDWHIIALNSNCSAVGGCDAGSAQASWLENDLINNKASCTLAFWHHPLFTSGSYQGIELQTGRGRYFWELLNKYNADIVANGHDHIYERFAPQTSDGSQQPKRGIREFVVGTGGVTLYKLHTEKTPNHEFGVDSTFGFLELELSDSSYAWQFIGSNGLTLDSGRSSCHS